VVEQCSIKMAASSRIRNPDPCEIVSPDASRARIVTAAGVAAAATSAVDEKLPA
jgi:hypothetical protein